MRTWSALPVIVRAIAAGGCSSPEPSAGSSVATPTPTPTIATNFKEALESAAHDLDVLASQGKAAEAYEFYSQRCKNLIGDLDSYKTFLSSWLEGRNPQYSGVTVKVNGSSGQVVSVDNGPERTGEHHEPANLDLHRRSMAVRQLLTATPAGVDVAERIDDYAVF